MCEYAFQILRNIRALQGGFMVHRLQWHWPFVCIMSVLPHGVSVHEVKRPVVIVVITLAVVIPLKSRGSCAR